MAASSSRILDSCCACIVFSRTYQLVWHLTYRMVWCQAALATVLATTLLTLPAPPRKSARHEIIGNPQTKGERHDPPDASTRSTPGPGAGTHRRFRNPRSTPAPWKTVDCEIDLRPGGS